MFFDGPGFNIQTRKYFDQFTNEKLSVKKFLKGVKKKIKKKAKVHIVTKKEKCLN